jgi:hypothetical protein
MHPCHLLGRTVTILRDNTCKKTASMYKVIDGSGACVTFRLLYEDDTLGQIVASSQFDPIEVIGVSGTTIYGYYPNPVSRGGAWLRKPTEWGNAIDGSLSAEPKPINKAAGVSGLSSNERVSKHSSVLRVFRWVLELARYLNLLVAYHTKLFNLWGDFNNFNYAKHNGIVCSARPAAIDDWTGFFSGSRGLYIAQSKATRN